jgi:hypothetical protein
MESRLAIRQTRGQTHDTVTILPSHQKNQQSPGETKVSTTRTITLFDRRPVTIIEHHWPVIASTVAYDDERNPTQANRTWTIKIREQRNKHEGDVAQYLVYGVYASDWEDEPNRRGGYLVNEQLGHRVTDAIVKAVWDVVERLGFDTRLGDEVIAALPPETL